VRTRVGYSGGKKQNPTYEDIGDHTESIEIDYDPAKITYAELVDRFWQWHNPCSRASSRQYMSAVFYRTDEQRRLGEETKAREAKRRGQAIHTAVLPYEKFWIAEDYHQKYYLRHEPAVMREFAAVYPDWRDFTNSTAVARANAYVAGHGTSSTLRAELSSLGLSAEAGGRLLEALRE
jgi:methionine-S-sulfoxide reductase